MKYFCDTSPLLPFPLISINCFWFLSYQQTNTVELGDFSVGQRVVSISRSKEWEYRNIHPYIYASDCLLSNRYALLSWVHLEAAVQTEMTYKFYVCIWVYYYIPFYIVYIIGIGLYIHISLASYTLFKYLSSRAKPNAKMCPHFANANSILSATNSRTPPPSQSIAVDAAAALHATDNWQSSSRGYGIFDPTPSDSYEFLLAKSHWLLFHPYDRFSHSVHIFVSHIWGMHSRSLDMMMVCFALSKQNKTAIRWHTTLNWTDW